MQEIKLRQSRGNISRCLIYNPSHFLCRFLEAPYIRKSLYFLGYVSIVFARRISNDSYVFHLSHLAFLAKLMKSKVTGARA